jgi:hypothetical protein
LRAEVGRRTKSGKSFMLLAARRRAYQRHITSRRETDLV